MGLFDSITGWIRKESSDVGDALDDVTESLDRDLGRKERALAATPEERLAMIQDQIDDDPFAAIRDRIEASTAHADAESEVDAIDGPVLDGSDATASDDAAADDPVSEDPATDDPATDDPATDDPATEDATVEAATTPDPSVEDADLVED